MNFFSYFNSKKMLFALLKIAAGVFFVFLLIYLINRSSEDLTMNIIYGVIWSIPAIMCFVSGFSGVRDAVRFIRENSKQSRYELDDLLICRVKGGRIQ